VLRTVIFFFHYTLAYLLMLIAMTYSVGLFLSVMAGAACGYFLFERRPSLDDEAFTTACH
jgi:hypothetical protein